jgi:hypothetical protein
MAIIGAHSLLYSSQPDELRAVLKDVFGFDHVDARDGWLIFKLPPAEVAVHPSEAPSHELTFMCDDIAATMAELRDKGITFKDEPADQGWGIVSYMQLPGGLDVMLYEPRHPTAI